MAAETLGKKGDCNKANKKDTFKCATLVLLLRCLQDKGVASRQTKRHIKVCEYINPQYRPSHTHTHTHPEAHFKKSASTHTQIARDLNKLFPRCF